ncbi:calcium-binding protein [Planktotalea sp.]|uniref:calcium-binding protein n=1 Tax=Planktotalea sp. TaxID=2029877 RepID=UPI003D6ADE94
MTTTFQSTDSIGAGQRFSFADAGDTLVVLSGVTMASTDSRAIASSFSNSSLRLDGSVYSPDSPAIDFGAGSSQITIGENGIVASHTGFTGAAVRMDAADNVLSSAGEISNPGGIGVLLAGDDCQAMNSGSIVASTGLIVGFTGSGSSLYNTGLIFANDDDNIGNDPNVTQMSHGVHVEGNETAITNAAGGEIIASGWGKAGVHVGLGIASTGNWSVVLNHGLISSLQGYGVDFSDMLAAEAASLTNHGTISGAMASFIGNVSGETIVNTGLMDGAVLTNDGDDRFENTGTVQGDVDLGDGADTYRGLGESFVFGDVLGGAGKDRLYGGENIDKLFGNADADRIRGRQGDDDLIGGTGEDDIRGQLGNDVIEGNQDNDRLGGGQGNDIIKGGSGLDTITGGMGEDTLTGGMGADVFVFNRRSGDDEITDFNNNTDKLDLSKFALSSRQDLTDAGAIIENGAGSIIDLTAVGGDGVIYVEDMSVAQWSNADFIFA